MQEQLNPRAVYRRLREQGFEWTRNKLKKEPDLRALPHVLAGKQMYGMMVWLADLLSERVATDHNRRIAEAALRDYGFLLEKKVLTEFKQPIDENNLFFIGTIRRVNYRLLLKQYKAAFEQTKARKVRRALRAFSKQNPALLSHEKETDLAKIIARTMRQTIRLRIVPHLARGDLGVFRHSAKSLAHEMNVKKQSSIYNGVKKIVSE